MGPSGGLAVRVALPVGGVVTEVPWTPPSWDEVVRTHSA
ncbi:MAG: hypothetical protein QOE99_2110, partial [Actinomycetota bacterium]|nr:hypothetical protein [Actinomycetota bacterium]